eukprot:c2141_g1_i1.p1 GENE.c2141_g1_i1~~c2141_g1_i1.p1  ORF type:complete len:1094 (+),score=322.21 c2141_g1_i1:39-3284(+)
MADTKTKENEPTAAENTTRRDALLAIQERVQKMWADNKAFERNVDPSTPKYLGCFPYPYMNGQLHLGHTFTISKVEFACGFQRMLGKNALFPFAFHCTGMPIQACANKLRDEIKDFGNPPRFPDEEQPEQDPKDEQQQQTQEQPAEQKTNAVKADPTQFKSNKSKATAKKSSNRQWKIMQSLGFTDEEIPAFVDPNKWLTYFPPVGQEDVTSLGCRVDWRRSFITTDVNPYYDAFIKWQFNTLRKLQKVKFGKRYAVWSPKDNQQCADHERSSGEGHGPQEYTIIKMEVLKPFPDALKSLENSGKNVYLAAATLRPETMYGQTNCWIKPDGEYGAFEIDDKTIYILTERAARNLSFQDRSPKPGETKCLLAFKGTDIIGTRTKSPNCQYEAIYTLPMMTISTNKTTGVVTSVPSDSPDDYMALQDLKNKPALRQKFNIKDEWVLPFEPIPIIEVEGESNMYAVQVCNEMKITSQNDRVKLENAHDIVYKKGFYQGKMIAGPFAGRKVEEAKPLIRNQLLEAGLADKYAEPAGLVMSRSGDECVVALCDQWYLDYGESAWLSITRDCLQNADCFHEEVRRQFESALGWLDQWACSREFGLGTRLPWDDKWLIESLSDSTIYMAYYTVAHYLQGDMYGSRPGLLGITPDKLTDRVWDYIFLKGPYPADCGIPEADLQKMQTEFHYFYPVDLRVSGKDLIQNHLTFFMYNHTALFPQDKWPKGIRCNGHLMLNNAKMSKSDGNFLTMREAIQKFSSDATRLSLADAGDGVDDANFVNSTADKAILRLTTLLDMCSSFMEGDLATRDSLAEQNFMDRWFKASLQKGVLETKAFYERNNFREALRAGFFDLSKAYGLYNVALTGQPPHKDLVRLYLEMQTLALVPITPHTCEELWRLLGHNGMVVDAHWPEIGQPDEIILEQGDYLFSFVRDLRLALQKFKSPKKGPELVASKLTVYVAKEYPEWQHILLTLLQGLYQQHKAVPTKDVYTKVVIEHPVLKPVMKKAMSVAAFVLEKCAEVGERALATTVSFDEIELLKENKDYISSTLDKHHIELIVRSVHEECPEQHKSLQAQALPLQPSFLFEV